MEHNNNQIISFNVCCIIVCFTHYIFEFELLSHHYHPQPRSRFNAVHSSPLRNSSLRISAKHVMINIREKKNYFVTEFLFSILTFLFPFLYCIPITQYLLQFQ